MTITQYEGFADVDLGEYLEDQGFGTVNTDIFVGVLPAPSSATETDCIAIFQNGSGEPYVTWAGERVELEIVVRSDNRQTAANNAYAVFNAIHKLTDTTMNSNAIYYYIRAKGSPRYIGIEADSKRFLYSFSVIVLKSIPTAEA